MRHLRHQSGLLRYDATNSTFVNLQTAESYCIDPYFIAHQVFDGNTNVSQLSRFPGLAIPSGNPNQLTVMPRVTLANVPGIVNDPAFYDPNTYGVGVARIMNKLQAQELFTSRDNLALRESGVATELPKQVWFEDRQTPLAASPRTSDSIDNDHDGYTDEADEAFVKRIGFGDMARLGATEFSWMATVTPDRTFIINTAGNSAGRDTTDQYLVSIVVFHNRAFHYNNQATLEDQERMLEVTLRGNGYGGGEIRLHKQIFLRWILSITIGLCYQLKVRSVHNFAGTVSASLTMRSKLLPMAPFTAMRRFKVLIGIEQNGYRRSRQIRPGLPQ